MQNPIKIIGLDPGLGRFGYASLSYTAVDKESLSLDDAGIFITNSRSTLHSRLNGIRSFFKDYIEQHKPSVVFIEQVFYFKNTNISIKIAYSLGAILSFFEELSIKYFFYTPPQVKKAINQSGKSKKVELLESLEKYVNGIDTVFGGKSFNSIRDAVDATAVATTGFLKEIAPQDKDSEVSTSKTTANQLLETQPVSL